MEDIVTLQNIASVVTFVAPGYFLLQTYSLIYAKRERDITRLIIESAVYSLPLIAATNFIWEKWLHNAPVTALNTEYSLLLLIFSIAAGLIISFLRVHWPVKQLAGAWGLGMPDEDFVRAQFSRLGSKNSSVTVTLKSGRVFSGTPMRGSIYSKGSTQRYYFGNLAWAKADDGWDERTGGLIVAMSEVEYIETPRLKTERSTDWPALKRKFSVAMRKWFSS